MDNNSNGVAQLSRVLARKDVLALAFGAMVGWGWIVLTGGFITSAGSLGAILAFVLGGMVIVLVGRFAYSQMLQPAQLIGIALITAGVVLVNLGE